MIISNEKQICFTCGRQLLELYDTDTVTQIGWQCPTCNEDWLFSQHLDSLQFCISKINNLNQAVNGLTDQYKEIDALKGYIGGLEGCIKTLEDRIQTLEKLAADSQK